MERRSQVDATKLSHLLAIEHGAILAACDEMGADDRLAIAECVRREHQVCSPTLL